MTRRVNEHEIAYLRLLSMFHLIMGAIAILGTVVLYFVFAYLHVRLILNIALCSVIGGLGVALIFAGIQLQRRRHYLFCVGLATVACFFFPFGTTLGILTLIMLCRPAVRDLFR